jgi:hypothetical protein
MRSLVFKKAATLVERCNLGHSIHNQRNIINNEYGRWQDLQPLELYMSRTAESLNTQESSVDISTSRYDDHCNGDLLILVLQLHCPRIQ